MDEEHIKDRMGLAEYNASMSTAKRLKVGCVIEDKYSTILTTGYNHMPEGFGDECEYKDEDTTLVIKPELIHAEEDAITYAAKEGIALVDGNLYVTHSPCMHCAKLIAQSGIKNVYYKEEYRIKDGIEFLRKCNINVIKVN